MNLYNYRSATENIYNLSLIQLSNLFVCDKKGGKKLWKSVYIRYYANQRLHLCKEFFIRKLPINIPPWYAITVKPCYLDLIKNKYSEYERIQDKEVKLHKEIKVGTSISLAQNP